MHPNVRTLRTAGTIETVVRYDRSQELTEEDRQRALDNIGAASSSDTAASLDLLRQEIQAVDDRVTALQPFLSVATKAELDEIVPLLIQNCIIYVEDASGAEGVGSGAAAYLALLSDNHVDLVKIYEEESLNDNAPDFRSYYLLAKA